jgi:hypothetical protein
MSTPNLEIPAVDPQWCLPDKPDSTSRLTGPAFARLIVAAREGGWPAVYRCWAEDRVTADGRPAKRHSLDQLLARREDLRAILSEAVEEKKTRLLSQLESVVERAALGPPDRTTDLRADGSVARVREDSRNRNYAAMWLLERTNPEKYASKRTVAVEGEVRHAHAHVHLVGTADNGSGYRVSYEALAELPEEKRRALLVLLEEVEQIRLEQKQRPALPEGNR